VGAPRGLMNARSAGGGVNARFARGGLKLRAAGRSHRR
jgi:hypothetical protein